MSKQPPGSAGVGDDALNAPEDAVDPEADLADADSMESSGAEPADDIVDVQFTVEPNYAGWRLDKYLTQKIRRASRTRVQEIIANDLVCERKLKASTPVWPGLTFSLRRRMRAEPTVPGVEHLKEVSLDEWLLVVDKPAGLPIHATARYHHNTLVGQLAQKYGPDFKAWPAHRLDRETSGLVVCGRTTVASRRMFELFSRGEVTKEYLAIVEGAPPDTFEVDAPIAEGTELIRIAVRIDRGVGRPAQTRFEVARRFERDGAAFAVVRCYPRTGRQHQIRIHAKEAGFPLVGDKMYGPDPEYFDRFTKHTLDEAAWARLRLPRQALHAAAISFAHPLSRQLVRFEAPWPEDLRRFAQD